MARNPRLAETLSIIKHPTLIGAATIAATAIGIVQSAYVVRTLHGELFGKLVLMQTTWQTIVLLTNFGTNINGMYGMAAAIGSSDSRKAADSLSYLIKGSLLSSCLAAVGAIALSFALPGYVGLGKKTLLAFSLTGILSIFAVPEVCAMAVIQARRRMSLFSALLVINATIDMIFTIFLTHRFSVYGALVASSAASVLSAPGYLYLISRDASASEGLVALFRRKVLRIHFLDGLWMAVDRNIGTLYSIIPYHIVSWIYGPAVTGSLRIASRLCEVSAIPQNAITTNAASLIPNAFARGEMGKAWRLFWSNIKLGGMIAAISAAVLLLFGKKILGLIYGPTGEASAFLIPSLIPYVLVAALGPIGTMYRLMNLVPKAVMRRAFLTLGTAVVLYAVLPASNPAFAGIARSAFYIVSTTYLLWLVLSHKEQAKRMSPVPVPMIQPQEGQLGNP
jgi:O-antigen/teichoic acid export membrane protein